MAKKAWRNPVFQRDWVCLGLTFILLSIVIGLPHSNLSNNSERTKNKKPRGFIKAEIFHYKDVLEYGSEKALTELGLIRQEGKQYIVKDGDCIFFKFNV